MGKKIGLVVAFLTLIIASLSADSFRFSFFWSKTIDATSSIEILVYDTDNDTPLANKTKNLQKITTIQEVAKIKYISTAGGIHTLSYKATPFTSPNDEGTAYPYNLFFHFVEEGQSTQEAIIEVGDDSSKTYPNGILEASTTINLGRGGNTDPHYVYIRAELTDIENFKSDANYASTVIIERTIN